MIAIPIHFLSFCFRILVINPSSKTDISMIEVLKLGPVLGCSGKFKWGSVVEAPVTPGVQKCPTVLVFIPLNARRILVLDPSTNFAALCCDDLGSEEFKYSSSCVGSDGAIYSSPMNALVALRAVVNMAVSPSSFDSLNAQQFDVCLRHNAELCQFTDKATHPRPGPHDRLFSMKQKRELPDKRSVNGRDDIRKVGFQSSEQPSNEG